MGFLDSIGDALASSAGAIGKGAATGYNQGEQQGYNRALQQEKLGLLARAHPLKPAKEDLPYDVKSALDTHEYMLTKASPQERNDYFASGMAHVNDATVQALGMYGPDVARMVHAAASQPQGTDISGLTQQISQRIGQLQAGSQPRPAGQGIQPLGFNPATGPNPSPPAGGANIPDSFVTPQVNPGYQWHDTALDTARTGLIGAQTAQTEYRTLNTLPAELQKLNAQTNQINDAIGLGHRNFNLKAANDDFAHAMESFKALTQFGHASQEQQQDAQKILIDAARTLRQGGASGQDILKSLIHNPGAFGMPGTLNEPAVRALMSRQGYQPDFINQVIGASGLGGATTITGGQPQNQGSFVDMGAPGGQQPGAPPPLPAVGPTGAPAAAAPTATWSLPVAKQLASQLGFTITSTTGGQHNQGSAHYDGRAVDVGVKGKTPEQVQQLMDTASRYGLTVRDERTRPPGQQVWSGPHVHLEWAANQPVASQGGQQTASPPGPVSGGPGPLGGAPAGPNPLQAVGVQTPATAKPVVNRWANQPDSVENAIWNQLVNGQTTVDSLERAYAKRPDRLAIVRAVAEDIRGQQNRNEYAGIPVASTYGATIPNDTNFAGSLGYRDVGNPTVTTRPVDVSPNVGPQVKPGPVVFDVPKPQAPPAKGGGPAPPKGKPSLSMNAPAPGGKAPPASGSRSFVDLTPPTGRPGRQASAGPSMFGVSSPPGGGASAGPSVTSPAPPGGGKPAAVPAPPVPTLKSGGDLAPPPPTYPLPSLDKVNQRVAQVPGLQSQPFSQPIRKYLAANKITDKYEQWNIYNWAYNKLIPHLKAQGIADAELKQTLFGTLNSYLKGRA